MLVISIAYSHPSKVLRFHCIVISIAVVIFEVSVGATEAGSVQPLYVHHGAVGIPRPTSWTQWPILSGVGFALANACKPAGYAGALVSLTYRPIETSEGNNTRACSWSKQTLALS